MKPGVSTQNPGHAVLPGEVGEIAIFRQLVSELRNDVMLRQARP
jgi:hypothetical protein